jgi:ligand-binding sensor domain-containing protein
MRLFSLFVFSLLSCGIKVDYISIPSDWVYTIILHNDTLYWSTNSGQIYHVSADNPDSVQRLGLDRFYPVRSLVFKKNGNLYASSYQTGIHRVTKDSMNPCIKMWRMGWSMKTDSADNIWLAGKQGVFRQYNDTLLKFSDLSEAYDIDFYTGKIAVAHRNGITLFNIDTETADTTLCSGTICWSIDVFDSILIGGGVETCLIHSNSESKQIRLTPKHNIQWRAERDSSGTVFLGTQKGLFRILPRATKAECIGFSGKCIKSLRIDIKGRLWVGRYFNP